MLDFTGTHSTRTRPDAYTAGWLLSANLVLALCVVLGTPSRVLAQLEEVPAPDTTIVATPVGLPIFFTLGLARGTRTDACTLCESPLDIKSFSAHVSLGKYLGNGLGVGVDASVWKRGRPGTPGPLDSLGVAERTTLSNTLGNASATLSYEVWHAWVKAGTGIAWGSQDQEAIQDDKAIVATASGKGIGYTFGGGLALPLHPMIALAVFGNLNVGNYDLTSLNGVLERGVQHKYWEVGFGVTLR